MNDIATTEDIFDVKEYQQYIRNGKIMNAKKWYRAKNAEGKLEHTLVSATEINALTNLILRTEQDALNKTQDWITYEEMNDSALIGDFAFV